MNDKRKSLPEFSVPPVVEVALTAQFRETDPMLVVKHLNRLHTKLGTKAFPVVQLKPPRPKLAGFPQSLQIVFGTEDNYAPPLVWFLSADGVKLIQIQHDRVSFNWRRVIPGGAQANYISFENVFKFFKSTLMAVNTILSDSEDDGLALNYLEMAYINAIPYTAFGGASHIADCFPFMDYGKFPKPLERQARSVSFNWEIEGPDNRSSIQVSGATAASGLSEGPALILSLAQRSPVSMSLSAGTEPIEKWFDDAHITLVNTFVGITSPKMHDLWGRSQ